MNTDRCTNTLLLFIFALAINFDLSAQCILKIDGHIVDEATHAPLSFANVLIQETGTGTQADYEGSFIIEDLCPGEYHLKVSHIGCDDQSYFIVLTKDTSLHLHLLHHTSLLDEVVVHGHTAELSTGFSESIDRTQVLKGTQNQLSEVIESFAGVSTLKTGSNISKPIIHGLYGNRVSIINNGINLSGQQWGNDHAPEIDPFSSNHISVLKGVSSLEYAGSSLGGVVIVDPSSPTNDPHLHGEVLSRFQSNGRSLLSSAQLEQATKAFAWRINATFLKAGDQEAPSYFLTNTGLQQESGTIQLNKSIGSKYEASIYYSLYNYKNGILRGAHIGNLTDLDLSLNRQKPFFTEDYFSYNINAPRQDVNHHLLKASLKQYLTNNSVISYTIAGQFDRRQEFDVRRGGRSNIPSLSIDQWQYFFEAKYSTELANNLLLKFGLQYEYIDNINSPETGILPLIPDYESIMPAMFGILKGHWHKKQYELGLRATYRNHDVRTIRRTLPRSIESFDHNFVDFQASAGLKESISSDFSYHINIGLAQRNPAINELHSFGLHQGVASFEEGNSKLNKETSFKLIAGINYSKNQNLYVEVIGYIQHVNDYIYLQPQSKTILTIRGAFPHFIYAQTNALLVGSDILFTFEPYDQFKMIGKLALLRARDRQNKDQLIFSPANNYDLKLEYHFKDKGRFSNLGIWTNTGIVGRQNATQTYEEPLPPPDGYFILDLGFQTDIKIGTENFKISISVDNVLNEEYRDYLNRLRYFADEVGRNITFNMIYKF